MCSRFPQGLAKHYRALKANNQRSGGWGTDASPDVGTEVQPLGAEHQEHWRLYGGGGGYDAATPVNNKQTSPGLQMPPCPPDPLPSPETTFLLNVVSTTHLCGTENCTNVFSFPEPTTVWPYLAAKGTLQM